MRKITAEQLTRLDNILKCWVMKEIIKGNVKYVEFNQLDKRQIDRLTNGGVEMLTKKQLEDAAECMSHDCESCGVREFAGGCCQIATAQTAIAYRKMLERLEWIEHKDWLVECCPFCKKGKNQGHAADCELAALLKESEVEEG